MADELEGRLRQCLGAMAQEGVRRVVLYGPTSATRIVLGLAGQDGVEVVGEPAPGEGEAGQAGGRLSPLRMR